MVCVINIDDSFLEKKMITDFHLFHGYKFNNLSKNEFILFLDAS